MRRATSLGVGDEAGIDNWAASFIKAPQAQGVSSVPTHDWEHRELKVKRSGAATHWPFVRLYFRL
jgi:hypothetical protein